MNILALDSATTACSAAVWVDGAVVAAERTEQPRGQAEILLPLVERVRARSGLPFGAFDRFAVTVGPGHFTGLRAGLAAARGLALAADRPLIGVTTLEAIAAAVPAPEGDGAIVLVALDSKRAQPFVQAFDAGGAPLEPPSARAVADYAAQWHGQAAGRRLVTAGDRGPTLHAALAGLGRAAAQASSSPLPDAAWVATLAAARTPAGAPPAPLYIHPVETTTPRPRRGVRG